jgi:tetrahydromethanopterin S-methyltransferase subunit G
MVIKKALRKLLRRKRRTKTVEKEEVDKHKVLRSWEDIYGELSEHPLTQAKIINEQLLHSTNDALNEINNKLDGLDERVGALERKRPTVRRNKDDKLPSVVIPRANLSNQEEQIVQLIESQNEVDAKTVAQKFNISRSNSSLKLNKLHSWGFLAKRLDEKSVFFRIKD